MDSVNTTSSSAPRSSTLRLAAWMNRSYSIPEASLLLMVAFLASAALGGVRQIMFNAQFGAGPDASAYIAAFRLPDLLFNLIAGGALANAMIPVLLASQHRGGAQAGERLTRLVLTIMLTAVAICTAICWVLTPAFVEGVLAPGFSPEQQALTVMLTRIMLLQPLALAVASVAIAVLNSRNQFTLTALSIFSQNFTIILGIIATMLVPSIGIYGPTIGVVAGAALKAAILIPGLLTQGFRYRPVWDVRDPDLRELVRLMIPSAISITVNYGGAIVDTSFGSRAREAAALPALYNGWLLADLPSRLLGAAVGQSAFPRLAAYVAAGEWQRMRRTLLRSLGAATALAIPAVAAIMLLGRPAIGFVLERGRFDASAVELTMMVLSLYVLGLPAYIGTEMLTRGLIAMHDTHTPLITNCLQLGGRMLILSLTIETHGIAAVPLAHITTSALETLLLGFMLERRLRRAEIKSSSESPAPPP